MFESCSNSKETQEELIKLISSVELSEVQKQIRKKFYNVDSVVEFIYNTIITGGNGVLHGPGGFGKSEITKAFFELYGIHPLVIVGHSGTDIESLLGIPNIKKLTEDSVHEIAFEKSVFNKPGVLILEEFLDVKPAVASALKDIITSGGYRRGDEFIPSKIGSIFICSNKSPDEVSIDFSTAAFYKERFPYSKYVIWDDYTSKSYLNLFKLRYGDEVDSNEDAFKLIAHLCASSCNQESIISPRMAFSAMDLFKINKDIRILNMVAALDTSKIDAIKARIDLETQHTHLFSRITNLTTMISKLEFDTPDKILGYYYLSKKLRDKLVKANVVGDDLVEAISNLISLIETKVRESKTSLYLMGKLYTDSISEVTDAYEDIQKFIP